MSALRVGFFGDGEWAVKSLDRLVRSPDAEVLFVCLRHGSPDEALGAAADRVGVPIIDLPDVNSASSIRVLTDYACDVFVSMSFDQIMRRRMFSLPPLGTINCHAGMLPFYRGRSVLNWALINGEDRIGVTVHLVDDGVDTGDILVQHVIEITDRDDYGTLLERGSDACADAVEEAVTRLANGSITPVAQSSIDQFGSYFTRRVPGDERIDWTRPSRDVVNLVRGVAPPGPGALASIGPDEWRILRAVNHVEAAPWRMVCGAVLPSAPGTFRVKTGDTFVDVIEWTGPRRPRVGERFSIDPMAAPIPEKDG